MYPGMSWYSVSGGTLKIDGPPEAPKGFEHGEGGAIPPRLRHCKRGWIGWDSSQAGGCQKRAAAKTWHCLAAKGLTVRRTSEVRNPARDGGALICAQQKGSGAKSIYWSLSRRQHRSPGPEPLYSWSQGFFLRICILFKAKPATGGRRWDLSPGPYLVHAGDQLEQRI